MLLLCLSVRARNTHTHKDKFLQKLRHIQDIFREDNEPQVLEHDEDPHKVERELGKPICDRIWWAIHCVSGLPIRDDIWHAIRRVHMDMEEKGSVCGGRHVLL